MHMFRGSLCRWGLPSAFPSPVPLSLSPLSLSRLPRPVLRHRRTVPNVLSSVAPHIPNLNPQNPSPEPKPLNPKPSTAVVSVLTFEELCSRDWTLFGFYTGTNGPKFDLGQTPPHTLFPNPEPRTRH